MVKFEVHTFQDFLDINFVTWNPFSRPDPNSEDKTRCFDDYTLNVPRDDTDCFLLLASGGEDGGQASHGVGKEGDGLFQVSGEVEVTDPRSGARNKALEVTGRELRG